jgi:integrase
VFLDPGPELTMASLKYDHKTGKARIFFRYNGRQFNRTVKVKSERAGLALCETIDLALSDLECGKSSLPDDADVASFLLSGGKLVKAPAQTTALTESKSLIDLIGMYQTAPPPHLEKSTQRMQEIHFRRLKEVFCSKPLEQLTRTDAQNYVASRSKQKYRGRPIQPETIEKELQTLRQSWAWVALHSPDIPPPPFALRELSFPKAKEKLPFKTWAQIEKEISRDKLTPDEISELWECLWLNRVEVKHFLEHLKQAGGPGYLHPMVCFAAYTGARRSELCRSHIADWHFDDNIVKIRQKKRDKEKEFTFRDAPIHPQLAEVMMQWFADHPGGRFAFCSSGRVEISWDKATSHLKAALKGSKWEVVRGWHVLRHSFASNLAAAGTDQRKIDRWMGHSTDVRLRYQHLRPEDQLEDIAVL